MIAPLENPRNLLGIGTLDGLERFIAGCGLDAGIRRYVAILRSQGVETCQSCEGGPGHCYAVPTVEFLGDQGEGYRAVSIAITFGLPVYDLKRAWHIQSGELTGPIWSMTFREKSDPAFAASEAVEPHGREDELSALREKLARIIDPIAFGQPRINLWRDRISSAYARVDDILAATGTLVSSQQGNTP